jgi:cell wall-associated NlpC family hydrolase
VGQHFKDVFVIFATQSNYQKTLIVKNLLILFFIALTAASCSTLKPASTPASSNVPQKNKSSVQFLDNVSLNPEGHSDRTGTSYVSNNPSVNSTYKHSAKYSSGAIENYSPLQFKYSILIDAPVEEMNNEKLLSFIDEWYGTHYKYGGSAKDGIDCSAFAASLISNVYGVNNLPRMSKDQYDASRRIKRNDLQEGDLVFFHTLGKRKSVTHVGVYLRNGKFIHASISGVMISSLDDGYYAQHFVGAGRVI